MRVIGFLLLGIFCASSLSAWDRFGHLLVGAMAWEHMEDTTRAAAVELLKSAPSDAGLALLALSPRDLFLHAAYWPDVVRDEAWPARKEAYDRPTWHYVNHFWRDGEPLPETGTLGELLERLNVLGRGLDGGVEVSWLLHLVGDVHQPLHSSSRVTDREPEGDRGGNDFGLDDFETSNLHAYWDTILKRIHRKRHSESSTAWVSRVARELMESHPPESLRDAIAVAGFEAWSKASAEIAMTRAYPEYLSRDAVPPAGYEAEASEIASKQVALAGYRLARLLDDLLQ